jgi:hypothetical protein
VKQPVHLRAFGLGVALVAIGCGGNDQRNRLEVGHEPPAASHATGSGGSHSIGNAGAHGADDAGAAVGENQGALKVHSRYEHPLAATATALRSCKVT